MKIKLLIVILASLLLIGCSIGFKNTKTQETAVDLSASTIGYYVGQNNIDRIPQWNEWLDPILKLEQGDTVFTYEKLLKKGLALVSDDPFLEMQFKKLLNLLDFPELQPPELPFLTGDYVKMIRLVLGAFQEGLAVAEKKANNG